MNETAKPLSIPNWTQSKSLSEIPSFEPIHLPFYLLYLSSTTFEPLYVSRDVKLFLGVSDEEFVSNKGIWKQIIPVGDHKKVFGKFQELGELKPSHEIDFTHRILGCDGVPSWVSHRIRVESANGLRRFRGYMIPIASDDFSRLLEPSTISSFIHRLGNHFQLLNLALDPLRRHAAAAQEANAMQETLDKSVSLIRAFSEYSQVPAWVTFDLMEIIDSATVSQSPALMEKRIKLEQEFDPAVNGLLIRGDPYLLELAVAAILQNASEATSAGGKIKLKASVNARDGISVSASLVIIDDGVGIEPCDLSKVTLPFFSTKANHDGLGLSMAARFVELHRGALKVKSESGEGVTVEVILPLNVDVDEGCR
jgi:two-component sensor histidine kinase